MKEHHGFGARHGKRMTQFLQENCISDDVQDMLNIVLLPGGMLHST
jgi:hypothetical protein